MDIVVQLLEQTHIHFNCCRYSLASRPYHISSGSVGDSLFCHRALCTLALAFAPNAAAFLFCRMVVGLRHAAGEVLSVSLISDMLSWLGVYVDVGGFCVSR
jgi:hypothetical protein